MRVFHPEGGESKVKQADADRHEINSIVRKYIAHGVAPPLGGKPTYGDFSSAVDFHTAMNRVRDAEAVFADLPSEVRARVDNDPGVFLDMVFDDDGQRELLELGLVEGFVPEAAPEPAEPVPPSKPLSGDPSPVSGGE